MNIAIPGRQLGSVAAVWLCLWGASLESASCATVPASWDLPPHQAQEGIFWEEHWYERHGEGMPPAGTRRLRINAPETTLGRFGHRIEARENGLMLIQAAADLFQITAAELYVELWGGHPGTANKRISVNGRNTYPLPRVGTEEGHCTYNYPYVPLALSDLVSGWNAFQWSLDQGSTFWGHAMVDNACLRLALTNHHPQLLAVELQDFSARVEAVFQREESIGLRLQTSMPDRISRVHYQAWYRGYDENGNRQETDWHGFTFDRQWQALAGAAEGAPFTAAWNTRMLPAQHNIAIRALIRFHNQPSLVYVTPALTGLVIPARKDVIVQLVHCTDLPVPFWSRAGRKLEAAMHLDMPPELIEAAELYVVSWTGGAGTVKDYFTLNGHSYPVAEGHGHHIQYSRLPVDPATLRQGRNSVVLHSDTEHHGIELILPGPALMVRHRPSAEDSGRK